MIKFHWFATEIGNLSINCEELFDSSDQISYHGFVQCIGFVTFSNDTWISYDHNEQWTNTWQLKDTKIHTLDHLSIYYCGKISVNGFKITENSNFFRIRTYLSRTYMEDNMQTSCTEMSTWNDPKPFFFQFLIFYTLSYACNRMHLNDV